MIVCSVQRCPSSLFFCRPIIQLAKPFCDIHIERYLQYRHLVFRRFIILYTICISSSVRFWFKICSLLLQEIKETLLLILSSRCLIVSWSREIDIEAECIHPCFDCCSVFRELFQGLLFYYWR